MVPFPLRLGALAAAILTATTASAAPRIDARSRLEHCGSATCLLVTGHRADPTSPVMLAGHPVTVLGGRKWRASVPIETVRTWFPTRARVIAVRLGGVDGEEVAVPLPIGMLGSSIELASLEVRAR